MIYSLNEGTTNAAKTISNAINNKIKLIEKFAQEIEKSVLDKSNKPNRFLVANQKNLSTVVIATAIKKSFYSGDLKTANKKQIAILMAKCSKDGEFVKRLNDSKKTIANSVRGTSNEFIIKVNKSCNDAIKDVEAGFVLLKRYFRTDTIEESALFDNIDLL